jgi:hypothetical protein
MPQIYDMGPPALLPLRRKACWVFFRPEKSDGFGAGFEPANLGPRGQHASSRYTKVLVMTFLERNMTIMTVYTAVTWFMMRIVMVCNQHIHCQSCHLLMSTKVNIIK